MNRRKAIALGLGLAGIVSSADAFGQSQEDYQKWYANRVANAKTTAPFYHPILNPSNKILDSVAGYMRKEVVNGIKRDFPGKEVKIQKETFAYNSQILGFDNPDIVSEFSIQAYPVMKRVFDEAGLRVPSFSFSTLYAHTPVIERPGNIVPFYFIRDGDTRQRGQFDFEVDGKKFTDTVFTNLEPLPQGRVIQLNSSWKYSNGHKRENKKVGILVKMDGGDAINDRLIPAVELLHWELDKDFQKRVKTRLDSYNREATNNEIHFVTHSEHLLHESLVHALASHAYNGMLDDEGKKAVRKDIQRILAVSANYRRISEFMERFKTDSPAKVIQQYKDGTLR